MTAKEKALELLDKYSDKSIECNEGTEWTYDKECALICIDEILNTGINQDYIMQNGYYLSLIEFYEEVKEEINKL